MLERVYRRATKMIPKLNISYERRLRECGLTTPETCQGPISPMLLTAL